MRQTPRRAYYQLLHPRYGYSDLDDCYVELCASCIGSHTDYHAAKGTKPEYINIKEAYTLAANQVSTLQDSLTEQKVRIVSL